MHVSLRHCEERSDEAIHISTCGAMDCFAPLAMTTESAGWVSSAPPATDLPDDASPAAKNISVFRNGKSVLGIRPSHPNEGRLAIVTNVVWDAV
ncbi:hypothetical protein, partial [Bradyrhizobium erythrophlei]|uniref:hypothetical protein n=1 Tax=Bradyrhizobium erythrophlei TaxID=1437360 RepID=UPI00366D6467